MGQLFTSITSRMDYQRASSVSAVSMHFLCVVLSIPSATQNSVSDELRNFVKTAIGPKGVR